MRLNYINNSILDFRAEILSQLQRSKSAEFFLKEPLKLVNRLGFSDIDIMQVSTKEPYIHFVASSLPKDIFETYQQEELYRDDIVPDVLMRSIGFIYRSNIYEYIFNAPFSSIRFDRNRVIDELWESYGYSNCYCMPLTPQEVDTRLVVSVLEKDTTQSEFRHRVNRQRLRLKELYLIMDELTPQCKFLTPIKNESTILQDGDAELIKSFCILGTAQQVADHLNLEITTVNNKMTRIKKALGASSIANAVYNAIKEGLIKI